MTVPLITVLIDTYNYGRFIEEAIDSVLSQDFPMEQVEILVVDDGSTDDTAERVKKYGSRIRYLHKPNGGQASAFNFGFANAKGEIIALLDADDYFLPGKLRRIVLEFQGHPEAGMVYHKLLQLHMQSGEMRESEMVAMSGFLPNDRNQLLGFVPYPTSCLAFRRRVIEPLLPIPESLRIQADGFLALLVVLLAPVVAVTEPLAVYRIHGKNLCVTDYLTPSTEGTRRLIATNTVVLKEVRDWMKRHRKSLTFGDSKAFVGSRLVALRERQFEIDPPGRLSFFSFLLVQNYFYSAQQTWKLTAFNYLTAAAALFFGYEASRALYEWRWRTLKRISPFLGRS